MFVHKTVLLSYLFLQMLELTEIVGKLKVMFNKDSNACDPDLYFSRTYGYGWTQEKKANRWITFLISRILKYTQFNATDVIKCV